MTGPIILKNMVISTEHTGGSLDVPGPEGMVQFRRMDPHGVLMVFNGKDKLSIKKEDVPIMAKFFAAAALLLGEGESL